MQILKHAIVALGVTVAGCSSFTATIVQVIVDAGPDATATGGAVGMSGGTSSLGDASSTGGTSTQPQVEPLS